jgi:hypothetical protein
MAGSTALACKARRCKKHCPSVGWGKSRIRCAKPQRTDGLDRTSSTLPGNITLKTDTPQWGEERRRSFHETPPDLWQGTSRWVFYRRQGVDGQSPFDKRRMVTFPQTILCTTDDSSSCTPYFHHERTLTSPCLSRSAPVHLLPSSSPMCEAQKALPGRAR